MFGKHRLWCRFDITQRGIILAFEGSWTRSVSVVLVSMDIYVDAQQTNIESREVGSEIYSWHHDSPDVIHPERAAPVPPTELAAILKVMSGGLAFRFSVTTSEPTIAAPRRVMALRAS